MEIGVLAVYVFVAYVTYRVLLPGAKATYAKQVQTRGETNWETKGELNRLTGLLLMKALFWPLYVLIQMAAVSIIWTLWTLALVLQVIGYVAEKPIEAVKKEIAKPGARGERGV